MEAIHISKTAAVIHVFTVLHEGVSYCVKVCLVNDKFDNVEILYVGGVVGYEGDDGILRDAIEDYIDTNWYSIVKQ
jgi:hypothetical protein